MQYALARVPVQRGIKEECGPPPGSPSLKHVLALLRLGNHDVEVFFKFKQVRRGTLQLVCHSTMMASRWQALINHCSVPSAISDPLIRDIRADM